MKSLLLITGIFFCAQIAHAEQSILAKDVCADDYWKWCSSQESPFDCFKRRGFFKKDSILSLECKKAWSKPKPAEESPASQANTEAPQKLKALPRKQPASVDNSNDVEKKEEKTNDPDDFSDLDFQ